MEPMELRLSPLGKTWIFDLDGTLVEHDGYLFEGDVFLPGAKEFLLSIPAGDYIIILTARDEYARGLTERFLRGHGIRYDAILFGMPMGERILFNDSKPSGLKTAYAVQCERNRGLEHLKITVDPEM